MKNTTLAGVLAGTTCLLTVLSACGNAGNPGTGAGTQPGSAAGEAVAVATTTPLGSVVDEITRCAGGTSTTLMSPGDDPHSFAPSSGQVSTLVKSKLVVANGLGLEEGLGKVLDSAKKDGATVLEVAPLVDPIPFAEPDDHGHDEHAHDDHSHDDHDHATPAPGTTTPADDHDDHAHDGHDHAHGSQDPHFWLDAARMAKAAGIIGDRLAQQTGQDAYRTCGEKTRGALMTTHAQLKKTLSAIPEERRVLVTDHEAFGYFAKAYGFRVAGVVVPGGSTDAEPSSAELAALTKVVKDAKVPAVFSNTAASTKVTDALAKEVGSQVKVVPLFVGSVGAKDSDAATYAGMMTTNATLIADALKG